MNGTSLRSTPSSIQISGQGIHRVDRVVGVGEDSLLVQLGVEVVRRHQLPSGRPARRPHILATINARSGTSPCRVPDTTMPARTTSKWSAGYCLRRVPEA